MGGVKFSTSVKVGRVFAGAKFTIKKPSAIAAKIVSKCKKYAIPVERNSDPSEKPKILPESVITLRINKLKKKPITAPSTTQPQISYSKSKSCDATLAVRTPKSVAAMEEANAYKIRATASSKATIPSTVVVKGPLVRFSLSTSVVAAGAVAEDMAPSTRPSAKEVAKVFVAA